MAAHRRIDGQRVSLAWYRLLTEIRETDNVNFHVNSGRRTVAEQWRLFKLNMTWTRRGWAPKPNRPLTAFPSMLSPHIRTGRADHAVDFDNAEQVRMAAAKRGVTLRRTVLWPDGRVREEWHLEPDRKQLRAYYFKRQRQIRAAKQRREALRAKRITKISSRGVDLIAGFEGFSSKPYRDPVGVWTIGYGHTTGVSATSKPLSKRQARRLLVREINEHYAPAVAKLDLPLSQGQFDALTSFVFNLGVGAISADTGIGRELRAHRWARAADQMLRWDKAGGRVLPGLTRRRKAERDLFMSATK